MTNESLKNHIVKSRILPLETIRQEKPTLPHRSNGEQTEVFTTESKGFQIRRGHSISGRRLQRFMHYLFSLGLEKCSYGTLRFEFIRFRQTNDKRVIQKYIGCPKSTVRSSGKSLVRINRMSGNVAQFDYQNTIKVKSKRGLAQILGYITMDEKGNCVIHHERMPYFTEQIPLNNPPTRISERLSQKSSIDNLCVRPIGSEGGNREDVDRDRLVKKEEEVIGSAHTNQSSESNVNIKKSKLSPLELQILRAAQSGGSS